MVEITKEVLDIAKEIQKNISTFQGIRLLDVKCYMNARYGDKGEPNGIYGNSISSEAQLDELRQSIFNALRLLEILYPNTDYVPHQNFRRIKDTELTNDNKIEASIIINDLLDIIRGKENCAQLSKMYIERAEKFLQNNSLK